MRRLATISLGITLGLTVLATTAQAAPPRVTAQAEAQVLELSKEVMALRSVRGPGNQTAEVAQAFKAALVAGGWADGDIEITPFEDTAYLIATWPGTDPKL